MIEVLPEWMSVAFLLTSVLSLVLFYYSNGRPKKVVAILIGWAILQSILAYNLFYRVTGTVPPRFVLVLLPVFALIIYGSTGNRKKIMIAKRDLRMSSFLHIVRIPVEIVLVCLFGYGVVPEIMTFEGLNFDILAGVTAILFGTLYFLKKIGIRFMIIWNIISLVLIVTILIIGVFSSELPIQLFALDQPNIAMTYFPFILLPALVAPLVLYQHIIDIMKLIQLHKKKKQQKVIS